MHSRTRKVIVLTVFLALVLVGSGYWWGSRTVDSVTIRNESDHKVVGTRGGSATSCIWSVDAGTTGRVRIKRWDFSFCDGPIRFHFHNDDTSLQNCTWEAAESAQPVVVTNNSVSCNPSP
jgi:hypothetical protein